MEDKIQQMRKIYEEKPEPKMERDVFEAWIKTYERYHETFKNLRDR